MKKTISSHIVTIRIALIALLFIYTLVANA